MFHDIAGRGGRGFPRCDAHANAAYERHESSLARYAHSDVAPDWFDPADAGEVWSEDDY